jgi:nucleoside-diphosphate-sugar epimerase
MRLIHKSKVAVIGGAGFLGSQLVDYLIDEKECEVLVLDCLINGHRKFVNSKAEFLWFDIRDSEDALRKVLKDHQIEYVFNYAAEPYIPVSFARPLHVFNINAFAAIKVLNASQEAGVRAILQVSSAEIYGDMKGKIKETDYVVPHSTYGVAKVAADAMVQVRWKEAHTPAIAMRQFNCVGPRETHPYVIPEIISQLYDPANMKKGDPKTAIIKLGNNSVRDFQYSRDAVRMAVALLENGEFGEVYNMGSQDTIQIYALAKLIGDIIGVNVEVETDQARVRPWEIWHLQSDNTKLYKIIGKQKPTPLRVALEGAIKYFNDNGQKWDFKNGKL